MNDKTYHQAAGLIFLIVVALHLWRITQALPAFVGDIEIPMWASWASVVIAGYLAYRGFQIAGKMK